MSGHHHHHFHTDGATDYYIYRHTTGETDNSSEGGGFWALFWLVIIVGAFAWGWVTGTALPWLLHSGVLHVLGIALIVVLLVQALRPRRRYSMPTEFHHDPNSVPLPGMPVRHSFLWHVSNGRIGQ